MELEQGSSKNGAMQVEQVLFMNGGEGDNSYAKNSAPPVNLIYKLQSHFPSLLMFTL